jgi:hypothetical protein
MTDGEPMTLAAFDEALLRFGADVARWPEGERRRAMALLAESVEAKSLMAEEEALHGIVAAALHVDAHPSALVARVQQSVAERRRRGGALARFRLLWPMIAGGAVAAIACGIGIGLLLPLAPGLDSDALLMTLLGGGFL